VFAINLTLHDAGDIGLEFYIVYQLQATALEEGNLEVSLVGALFTAFGVDAEYACGIGGFKADGAEGAVVSFVDTDVQLFTIGTDKNRSTFSYHVFYQLVAVGIEVIVAKVEGDVERLDGIIGIKSNLDLVGMCCKGQGE
jgi:hypothetical protein